MKISGARMAESDVDDEFVIKLQQENTKKLEQLSSSNHNITRQNALIPLTHVPETGDGKVESNYGAGFCSMCHRYKDILPCSGRSS